MNHFLDSLRQMFGGEPKLKLDPEDYSDAAKAMHAAKNEPEQRKARVAAIREELAHHKESYRWRKWRWTSIIVINLLFVISYHLDVQLVEGALTASRFVGFHMADVNAALQVVLAQKQILINLVIGVVTVAILWWLVGGRTFCSWACPYHLVAELAEKLHLKLVDKKIVEDHPLHRGTRTVLYVVFAALAFITGYTVFETVSPVGILSRALIYGGGIALVWVAVLLLVEIFYVRRLWCRYICPIGLTYGFLGTTSPITVHYELENCLHEGECRKVCLVPHVIEITKKNRSHDVKVDIGADCTRCGMCIEACPTGALSFRIKGLGDLL
ncbi:MAG: NapH/MauN family ferredoxin-type protein [Hyphomicrobiales bacterium]|nr:NapH/MauN family ferredoxin-type protein [Hyphomicrobiales bacterium]